MANPDDDAIRAFATAIRLKIPVTPGKPTPEETEARWAAIGRMVSVPPPARGRGKPPNPTKQFCDGVLDAIVAFEIAKRPDRTVNAIIGDLVKRPPFKGLSALSLKRRYYRLKKTRGDLFGQVPRDFTLNLILECGGVGVATPGRLRSAEEVVQ
jgi:hypothetical protein